MVSNLWRVKVYKNSQKISSGSTADQYIISYFISCISSLSNHQKTISLVGANPSHQLLLICSSLSTRRFLYQAISPFNQSCKPRNHLVLVAVRELARGAASGYLRPVPLPAVDIHAVKVNFFRRVYTLIT